MFFLQNIKEFVGKLIRFYYNIIFPLITLFIFQLIFLSPKISKLVDLTKVDHNSILTINLTLAGFLLTAISIMITIRDKEFIKILIEAGYFSDIERSALLGILFHIISALLALFNLIIHTCTTLLFNIEITTFAIGITYFVLTVVWLKITLKYL